MTGEKNGGFLAEKNSLPGPDNELVILQNGTDFSVLVFYFLWSRLAIRTYHVLSPAAIVRRPKYFFFDILLIFLFPYCKTEILI